MIDSRYVHFFPKCTNNIWTLRKAEPIQTLPSNSTSFMGFISPAQLPAVSRSRRALPASTTIAASTGKRCRLAPARSMHVFCFREIPADSEESKPYREMIRGAGLCIRPPGRLTTSPIRSRNWRSRICCCTRPHTFHPLCTRSARTTRTPDAIDSRYCSFCDLIKKLVATFQPKLSTKKPEFLCFSAAHNFHSESQDLFLKTVRSLWKQLVSMNLEKLGNY
jgi:hypothetical protein